MSTKNLLDNKSGRPQIFSDLTGEVTYEPRADLTESLILVHEAYAAMLAAVDPKVEPFSVRVAVVAVCLHLGWFPYEISAAEQYVAQTGLGTAQTTG